MTRLRLALLGAGALLAWGVPASADAQPAPGRADVEVSRLQERVRELEQQVAALQARQRADCGALAPALYHQATTALFEGRFQLAARAFQQIVDADADNARAQRGLGLALAELGQRERAIAAFRAYLGKSRGGDTAIRMHILERLRALEASGRGAPR